MAPSLLDMPAEVRQIIYRWIFRGQIIQWIPRRYRDEHQRATIDISIIYANPLVHAESRPILLQEATIDISEQLNEPMLAGATYLSKSIPPAVRHMWLDAEAALKVGILLPHLTALESLDVCMTGSLGSNTTYGFEAELADGDEALSSEDIEFVKRKPGRLYGDDEEDDPEYELLGMLSNWFENGMRYEMTFISEMILMASEDLFWASSTIAVRDNSLTYLTDGTDQLFHGEDLTHQRPHV